MPRSYSDFDDGLWSACRARDVLSRRLRVSALLSLIALSTSIPVLAEQPPRPEDELIQGSDLIVEADVLSVAKTGRLDAPLWLARLSIRKVLKGNPPSNPMEYWFLPPEPSLAGGRNEAVFAGQHLRLYLIRDNSVYYEPWASNSLELLGNFEEDRYVLPTKLGEVIYADGKRSLPDPPRNTRDSSLCRMKGVPGKSCGGRAIIRLRIRRIRNGNSHCSCHCFDATEH